MIDSELPSSDADDPGPPVLLKRLGNAVEANLARNKLETAGIPSFLSGENAFAGDVMHPLPYREVELFVPQSLVTDALEVLDAPPSDPDELLGDPYIDDPGRTAAFRAFVCAVVGWLFMFLAVYGIAIALPAFAYAVFLAFKAVMGSTERTTGTLATATVAIFVSAVGIAFAMMILLARA